MTKTQPYFTVHRSEIIEALAAVNEAVASKDTIPILQHVFLKPEGDHLILRGSNLDIEIETRCELLSSSTGDGLTVSADDFYRIVKNMPENAEIQLGAGKSSAQVEIKGARSKFNLHTLSVSDFPSMGAERPDFAFATPASMLTEALGKIAHAINTTMEERYYLMGVFIEALPSGKLAFVATDGLMLAAARITPNEMSSFRPPIVPTKTVKAIRKLFGQTKAVCSVYIDERKIVLECGDLSISSKLVDGQFPDYQRIIPPRNDIFFRADKDATSKAITRACVISGDTSREAIKLLIEASAMQIELATADGQSAVESVDVDYVGESQLRGFNGRFVNETLSSISTSSFRLYGTDPLAPGHFTPDSDADEDYIVMPMRV